MDLVYFVPAVLADLIARYSLSLRSFSCRRSVGDAPTAHSQLLRALPGDATRLRSWSGGIIQHVAQPFVAPASFVYCRADDLRRPSGPLVSASLCSSGPALQTSSFSIAAHSFVVATLFQSFRSLCRRQSLRCRLRRYGSLRTPAGGSYTARRRRPPSPFITLPPFGRSPGNLRVVNIPRRLLCRPWLLACVPSASGIRNFSRAPLSTADCMHGPKFNEL